MLNRLTQNLDFQSQALVLRSERQRVLASNIANADTPGYVARDMDFAGALRAATANLPQAASGPGPVATRPGHLGAGRAMESSSNGVSAAWARSEGSTLAYALASQNSIDRNTVDMDRERASFADNSVRYEAALRFINGSARTMLDAIKGQSQ